MFERSQGLPLGTALAKQDYRRQDAGDNFTSQKN
jgi:hypothetical protein